MNGDLSLSMALGGLRIANPDDSSQMPSNHDSSITTNDAELTEASDESEPAFPLRSSDPDEDPKQEQSSTNQQQQQQPQQQQQQPQQQQQQQELELQPPLPQQQQQQQELRQQQQEQEQPRQHQLQQLSPDLRQLPGPEQATATGSQSNQLGLPQPTTSSRIPIAREGVPDSNQTRSSYRESISGGQGDPAYVKRLSRTASQPGPAYSTAGLSRGPSHGSQTRRVNRQVPLPANGGPLPPRRSSRGVGGNYGVTHPGQAGPPYGSEDQPLPTSSEDWKDRGAAVSVRRELDASGKTVVRHVKKGVRDFAFGQILGEGSYSTVYLATDRQTLKEYAIKVLDKKHIIKEKKIKYVNIEKDTLNMLTQHPGIVRLYYTFQDENSLYYVLDLCNGGELLGVLKKMGSFDEECTRFYGAQILDAVEYMHARGVIHRDLKPENVLLDDEMHLKITDFGTAKKLKDSRGPPDGAVAGGGDTGRSASFVGTAEYVSPELLTNKTAGKASDLWAFGCIIYQLLTGKPPFKGGTEYLTFQKIVALDYDFPPEFPPAARDLIERCLVLDPARRLTVEHIKNHQFFDGQQFGKVLWRMKAPRLRPYDFQSKLPPAAAPGMFAAIPQQPPSSNNARSRIITEQPPTQLDIDWSSVLTRTNERILKLGDLMVVSTPLPTSPHGKGPDHPEGHKKLARFFGGSTTKKRQRLVIVTSSGRIVLAPSGGEEKRIKQEISLLGPECSWRTQTDAKGQLVWCVDSAGVHYTFEEMKSSSSLEPAMASAEDWIEMVEKAKDLATSQNLASAYNDDGGLVESPSGVPSPASTLGGRATYPDGFSASDRLGRSLLIKNQSAQEDKRNIFSKRQSKNGLGSAF